jgi:hypothetical protein
MRGLRHGWICAAAIVLASSPPAASTTVPPFALIVVDAPAALADPGREAAIRAVVGALETASLSARLGEPPRIRRCGPDEGPLTPTLLAASFSRAQERFFAGDFGAAWAEILQPFEALTGACRPLSAAVDDWADPGTVLALHDAGALLLSAGRELGRLEEAEATVRRTLAVFPGARPTDGMFPPSVADRYLDLEPDETEAAWIVVEAPGCLASVAGRVAGSEPVRVPAGEVAVALRCDGEAIVVTVRVAAGSSMRLAAPPAANDAALPRADRLLLRAAAAIASAVGVEACVAVEPLGASVRVASWKAPAFGAVWFGEPSDPSLVESVTATLTAAPDEADERFDAGWIGPALTLAAGAALGAGGAYELAVAEDQRALSRRAATAEGSDRLAGTANQLDVAGWVLLGVGAAVLAGGALWLILDLTEEEPEAGEREPGDIVAVPLVGPAVWGVRVAF